MDEEEFEFILTAIEFIAIYGQRFLPLYNFDLENGSWRIKKHKLETLTKEHRCLNIDNFKEGSDYIAGIKQVGMLRNKSLLTAKCIASRLSKFPSQSILDQHVDPRILHFLV